MKTKTKILALLLALLLFVTSLCGCTPVEELLQKVLPKEDAKATIEYTYSEEEFEKLKKKLEEFEAAALGDTSYIRIRTIEKELSIMLNHLSSQQSIAAILSYSDSNDRDAEDTYNQINEWYTEMVVLYNKAYRNVYEGSKYKDDIFADWGDEDVESLYDDLESVKEYSDKFNELSHKATLFDDEEAMTESPKVLVEMIKYGNLIAEGLGYDNYFEYANKEVFDRDYTVEDLEKFRKFIAEEIAYNMDELLISFQRDFSKLSYNDQMLVSNIFYETPDSFDTDYLAEYINSYSGTTRTYLNHAFKNGNITYGGANSGGTAFCTYIPDDKTPYLFFSPEYNTMSTVMHEVGHYYAMLFSYGASGAMDVNEMPSQTNELLFMNYLLENFESEKAAKVAYLYQIINISSTMIASTIVNEFEERVYTHSNPERLTADDFDEIMIDVCDNYGGYEYICEYVFDPLSYWRYVVPASPMYYISYATSAVASLSIVATALEDEEAGAEMFRILCEEIDVDMKFTEVLEELELPSVFQKEAFDLIGKVYQTVLG